MNGEREKKIRFNLTKDEDGYPPYESEFLWTKCLANGNFLVDSVPFFVPNISPEDEIEATLVNGELCFSRLVRQSLISTFRLLLADPNDCSVIRERLEELGCKCEINKSMGLLAVEIPAETDIYSFLDFIAEQKERGSLDFEEGALRHDIV